MLMLSQYIQYVLVDLCRVTTVHIGQFRLFHIWNVSYRVSVSVFFCFIHLQTRIYDSIQLNTRDNMTKS